MEKRWQFHSIYCNLGRKKYHNIGFQVKRHFFVENWLKWLKIVFITLTPGVHLLRHSGRHQPVQARVHHRAHRRRRDVPGQVIHNRKPDCT
jgi:hypothetical protein